MVPFPLAFDSARSVLAVKGPTLAASHSRLLRAGAGGLAVYRVAPTFVLKYNIRAVRALGSARSDLAGLDEVVEGGAGDVQYLGDRGLGDILAQQRPDVLLLAVEPGDRTVPVSDPDVSRPRLMRDASFLEADRRDIALRRTSRSTQTCGVMSARSSGRTSSSTARSRSTPPSSRCATLSVYFNTNLVSTPERVQARQRPLHALHDRYRR